MYPRSGLHCHAQQHLLRTVGLLLYGVPLMLAKVLPGLQPGPCACVGRVLDSTAVVLIPGGCQTGVTPLLVVYGSYS